MILCKSKVKSASKPQIFRGDKEKMKSIWLFNRKRNELREWYDDGRKYKSSNIDLIHLHTFQLDGILKITMRQSIAQNGSSNIAKRSQERRTEEKNPAVAAAERKSYKWFFQSVQLMCAIWLNVKWSAWCAYSSSYSSNSSNSTSLKHPFS